MATINISNLPSAGSELFVDSESFLDALSEGELLSIQGGIAQSTVASVLTLSSVPCGATFVITATIVIVAAEVDYYNHH